MDIRRGSKISVADQHAWEELENHRIKLRGENPKPN